MSHSGGNHLLTAFPRWLQLASVGFHDIISVLKYVVSAHLVHESDVEGELTKSFDKLVTYENKRSAQFEVMIVATFCSQDVAECSRICKMIKPK